MIRTPGSSSDQSDMSGATSGSAAICASISSSVNASSAAQSGSCLFAAGGGDFCLLIDIAFLSLGGAQRDHPIRLGPPRVDANELTPIDLPDRDDPGFAIVAPIVYPID